MSSPKKQRKGNKNQSKNKNSKKQKKRSLSWSKSLVDVIPDSPTVPSPWLQKIIDYDLSLLTRRGLSTNNSQKTICTNANIFSFNKNVIGDATKEREDSIQKEIQRKGGKVPKRRGKAKKGLEIYTNPDTPNKPTKDTVMRYIITKRKEYVRSVLTQLCEEGKLNLSKNEKESDFDKILDNWMIYEFLGFTEISTQTLALTSTTTVPQSTNSKSNKGIRFSVYIYYVGDNNNQENLSKTSNWKIVNPSLLDLFHSRHKYNWKSFLSYRDFSHVQLQTPCVERDIFTDNKILDSFYNHSKFPLFRPFKRLDPNPSHSRENLPGMIEIDVRWIAKRFKDEGKMLLKKNSNSNPNLKKSILKHQSSSSTSNSSSTNSNEEESESINSDDSVGGESFSNSSQASKEEEEESDSVNDSESDIEEMFIENSNVSNNEKEPSRLALHNLVPLTTHGQPYTCEDWISLPTIIPQNMDRIVASIGPIYENIIEVETKPEQRGLLKHDFNPSLITNALLLTLNPEGFTRNLMAQISSTKLTTVKNESTKYLEDLILNDNETAELIQSLLHEYLMSLIYLDLLEGDPFEDMVQ